MISCTEFIPSYSELFTYIEEKYGRAEVDNFWAYLFEPKEDGIPLINYIKKEGIHGCYSYWSGTLNEEAADFTIMLNEKQGWYKCKMYHCPSKGRLLELKDEIGIEPYHDYCLHCDYYRKSVSKIGLEYIYDFDGVDKAACTLLIYDPKVFDGRVIVDEDTLIMDRRASDNEYFHRDFHSSMNNGVQYLGEKYGTGDVVEYLTRFTNNVYKKNIEEIKVRGVDAILDKIRDTYAKEKAEDALEITNDGAKTVVTIKYCPAVKHLLATGRTMSPWYRYTTEVVMDIFAKAGGLTFTMESYDEATGAARYSFC